MHAQVHQLTSPLALHDQWEHAPWRDLPAQVLAHHMGSRPQPCPEVALKIGYSQRALYLLFRVQDQSVRARARKHQDPVWEDSCVEFFFTPGPNCSLGYFNLEMNCGGTMLFHFQARPRSERTIIPLELCERITTVHSLPPRVMPEITAPLSWTLAYRLPLELLSPYCPVVRPAPGVHWRGNFYKCGDKTSLPHWLTWAPINGPRPDFHRPDAFGSLHFL
ncbi:carbohydrate-binding family 9-like protein [Desulfogranum mediterraneum]|uniref:carbohydrate-binding family 9-like protein n=1 Tax=Desulfogranum mediterraneum TaxID=160661 RepID=UPI000683F999|nr:carbohydrate-binding family 9-like protein [Desulfogranum mediterraneum]